MLAWDHNAPYHRAVLRRLHSRMTEVLEVGCGLGHLSLRLAERADHVDAIDVDAQMVSATRALVPANVTCRQADVMASELADGAYDAVVSIAVLHHLDLAEALTRFAAVLRPGGVIVAVALPASDLPRDLPVELAAIVAHHVLGVGLSAVKHPWRTRLPHPADPGFVPTKDPTLTMRQIRAVARDVLPGVHVRRLLLWRYLLVWRKPGG